MSVKWSCTLTFMLVHTYNHHSQLCSFFVNICTINLRCAWVYVPWNSWNIFSEKFQQISCMEKSSSEMNITYNKYRELLMKGKETKEKEKPAKEITSYLLFLWVLSKHSPIYESLSVALEDTQSRKGCFNFIVYFFPSFCVYFLFWRQMAGNKINLDF